MVIRSTVGLGHLMVTDDAAVGWIRRVTRRNTPRTLLRDAVLIAEPAGDLGRRLVLGAVKLPLTYPSCSIPIDHVL